MRLVRFVGMGSSPTGTVPAPAITHRRPIVAAVLVAIVAAAAAGYLAWPRDGSPAVQEFAVVGGGTNLLRPAPGTLIEIPGSSLLRAGTALVKPIETPAATLRHPLATVVGAAVEISLRDTELTGPARIELSYDAAALPPDAGEDDLFLASLEGSAWRPLESSVDRARHVVTASADRFSTFAVLVPNLDQLVQFGRTVLTTVTTATLTTSFYVSARPPQCNPLSSSTEIIQSQELFLYCAGEPTGEPGRVKVKLVNARQFSVVVTPPAGIQVTPQLAPTIGTALTELLTLIPGQLIIPPGAQVDLTLSFDPQGGTVVIPAGPSNLSLAADLLVAAAATATGLGLLTSAADLIRCAVRAGFDAEASLDQWLRAAIQCVVRGAVAKVGEVTKGLGLGLFVKAAQALVALADQLAAQLTSLTEGRWQVEVRYLQPGTAEAAPVASPLAPTASPLLTASPTLTPAPIPTSSSWAMTFLRPAAGRYFSNQHDLVISADGRYVAAISQSENVANDSPLPATLYDLKTGNSVDIGGVSGTAGLTRGQGILLAQPIAMSANGSLIVYECRSPDYITATLCTYDRGSGTTAQLRLQIDEPFALFDRGWLALSADGGTILFSCVDGLNNMAVFCVYDRPSARTDVVVPTINGASLHGVGKADHLELSGDGRYVLFVASIEGGQSDQNIFRYDTSTGATVVVSLAADGGPSREADYSCCRASADGRYVVFSGRPWGQAPSNLFGISCSTQLFLRDITRNATRCLATPEPGSPLPWLSGSGERLLYNTYTYNPPETPHALELLNLASGKTIATIRGEPVELSRFVLSGDGRAVAFVCNGAGPLSVNGGPEQSCPGGALVVLTQDQ